jgi:protein phosphatase/serine/threonine-protein phosphatase Stp1
MTFLKRARFSAATHVGRTRTINQDSILTMPDHGIWLVADGMGGHEGGEYASQAVVDAVATLEPNLEPLEILRSLRSAILRAHEFILEEGKNRGGGTIGSTVVALALADEHFAALWAGDSRLYRLRGGKIELLTTDHSYVADLVSSGELDWDEADVHPQSNAITRAVGVGDELELEKVHGQVFPQDRYLLCSDGLTKYATFKELEDAMNGAAIETLADKLLQIALDGGGSDNISVIVVDIS